MAYIHEMALKNAQKRLYMLGSAEKRHSSSLGDDFAQGSKIGAGLSAMTARKAQNSLVSQVDEQNKQKNQMRADVADIIKQQNMQKMANQAVGGIAQERRDVDYISDLWPNKTSSEMAQQAADREAINSEADTARMGRMFTPSGLDSISKDAELNAQDRMRNRQMLQMAEQERRRPYGSMGIGGSQY